MTLDEIKRLIEFLREQDVTEFELDYDGVKLRVKSGAVTHAHADDVGHAARAGAADDRGAAGDRPRAPARRQPRSPKHPRKAPSWRSSSRRSSAPSTARRSPGRRPSSRSATRVSKGQVLCIIEAMKLMNEIDSEYDGEIVNVYVENGQAVQYGERLFAIRLK